MTVIRVIDSKECRKHSLLPWKRNKREHASNKVAPEIPSRRATEEPFSSEIIDTERPFVDSEKKQ